MKAHRHYCKYRRHMWEHEELPYGCSVYELVQCPSCITQSVAITSMIVPVVCTRCGTAKRDDQGRTLFVSYQWQKGKRMICPRCHEAEQSMDAMAKMVLGDDEEVPF